MNSINFYKCATSFEEVHKNWRNYSRSKHFDTYRISVQSKTTLRLGISPRFHYPQHSYIWIHFPKLNIVDTSMAVHIYKSRLYYINPYYKHNSYSPPSEINLKWKHLTSYSNMTYLSIWVYIFTLTAKRFDSVWIIGISTLSIGLWYTINYSCTIETSSVSFPACFRCTQVCRGATTSVTLVTLQGKNWNWILKYVV